MNEFDRDISPYKPLGLFLASIPLSENNAVLQTIALICSILYAAYKLYKDR